jgi:hypothetical protein
VGRHQAGLRGAGTHRNRPAKPHRRLGSGQDRVAGTRHEERRGQGGKHLGQSALHNENRKEKVTPFPLLGTMHSVLGFTR